VTALIAPVIPSSARPSARGLGRAGTARRLPVADVPVIRAAPEDVVYGFGRIDASGRVADRAITGALGWQPGDRLTLAADAGVVIARRDPGGMVTMRARPCIVIPAALRRRCGLRPGDQVLLATFPGEDTLAARRRPGPVLQPGPECPRTRTTAPLREPRDQTHGPHSNEWTTPALSAAGLLPRGSQCHAELCAATESRAPTRRSTPWPAKSAPS
jgi:hypothetical protein